MRKDKAASDVYDLLFGLPFLEPRYSLLFQDTQIEQLSPGQRGALLLIFYLLVDKGRNPIILDQLEENLDNQTVVSLLVPVLKKEDLHGLHALTDHHNKLVPSVGGVLLFGKEPEREFPDAWIQCGRFGVDKSVIVDTVECHGVLTKVTDCIRVHQKAHAAWFLSVWPFTTIDLR